MGAGRRRVLVLSSQHHASGINLQCARHVILIHPYCTPSATYPEAVSFASLKAHEQQAIGRVRRYPQTRTVRVHRLFAADTVEALLYRGGYAAEGAAAAQSEGRFLMRNAFAGVELLRDEPSCEGAEGAAAVARARPGAKEGAAWVTSAAVPAPVPVLGGGKSAGAAWASPAGDSGGPKDKRDAGTPERFHLFAC